MNDAFWGLKPLETPTNELFTTQKNEKIDVFWLFFSRINWNF